MSEHCEVPHVGRYDVVKIEGKKKMRHVIEGISIEKRTEPRKLYNSILILRMIMVKTEITAATLCVVVYKDCVPFLYRQTC